MLRQRARGSRSLAGGLRNKTTIVRSQSQNIQDAKGRVAYFTARGKLRARPNAHFVSRIYARDVATARRVQVDSTSTFWTGATSVYSRDYESFIKHSRFCRALSRPARREYPSSLVRTCTTKRARRDSTSLIMPEISPPTKNTIERK